MKENYWRHGAEIGSIYIVNEEELSRVGSCWMDGRLKPNDVVLCTGHSGDCFYNYVLIHVYFNGLSIIEESKFGAYYFGEKTKFQISEKEFHKLMSGEGLRISPVSGIEHELSKEISERKKKYMDKKSEERKVTLTDLFNKIINNPGELLSDVDREIKQIEKSLYET